MERGCSTWGSSKTPCSQAKPGFGGHGAGFGVHEEQSKVEHRDRQGRQEGGALSFCSPGCPTSPGHGIPNTGTHSGPLGPLQRCVCAPTHALKDDPKDDPSHWHHVPGREPAADPGSSEGRKNSVVHKEFGSRGDGQRVQAAQQCGTNPPRFLCLLGKMLLPPELHAFWKTTIPSIADDLFGKKLHFSLIILEAQNGLQHGVTLIAEKFSVCKCEL